MQDESYTFHPESSDSFTRLIVQRSEQPLTSCYQCRRCAAGCPVGEATGYLTPDRLIRLVILGDREKALNNHLVWQCLSCYTCGTRCPNHIHTSRVTESLKQIVREQGITPLHPRVVYFHGAFVQTSLFWGRMNELALMFGYERRNLLYLFKQRRWKEMLGEVKNQASFALGLFRLKRLHFGWTYSRGRKELKRLAGQREAGRGQRSNG